MPTTPLAKTLMDAVKQQLGAVGINAELQDAGPNFVTDILGGKYAASYFQFQATDPWYMMQFLLMPQGAYNPLHADDPQLAALIDRYRAGDAAAQQAVLKEINAYVTDQAWFASSVCLLLFNGFLLSCRPGAGGGRLTR